MSKKNSIKSMLLAMLITAGTGSCKKESILAPNEPVADATQTVIYIRAVDKDSSAVESERLLLR